MRGLAVSFLVALAGLHAGTAVAQSPAPAVQWTVADRFRLFDRASRPDRDAAERLLSDMESAARRGPLDLDRFYEPMRQLVANGASLRRSNYAPSPPQVPTLSGRYSADYLYPERYMIRVFAPDAGGAACRWRIGSVTVASPCNVSAEIPVAANGLGTGAAATLYLAVDGRPELAPVAIAIKDELIVAMGDSYISGEGNPDVPVRFRLPTHDSSGRFEGSDWPARLRRGTREGERREYDPALWWDQPCHRSLLSWPVLTALGRAAVDPHRAVTLVHLGCSGDEVTDGLVHFRRELPGGGRERQSQLEMLSALRDRPAGPQRPVDTLLLSIGGNDVGFAYVVAGLILPPNGWRLWGIAARAAGDDAPTACAYERENPPLSRFCGGLEEDHPVPIDRRPSELRLRELPDRMTQLADALQAAGIRRDRIFQVTYPNPLIDGDGAVCRSALTDEDLKRLRRRLRWTWPGGAIEARRRAELARETGYRDVHPDGDFGFEALLAVIPEGNRGGRRWRFQMRYDPERHVRERLLDGVECDNDPEPDDSETCQGLWVWSNLNRRVRQWTRAAGWGLIDGHQDAINKHGWCNSVRQGALSLRFPVAERGPDGLLLWPYGHPNDFDAYAQNNARWFRTTNDSALTQFEHPGMFHKGTIHPTFNAHVAMAQAALGQAFAAGP